jgi:hypothetical protein
MSKYDNLVYLAICEASVDFYHKTNFSTYPEYCKGLAKSLELGVLNNREKRDILTIMDFLHKVFSMSYAENGKYISEYFNLPPTRITEFQEVAVTTKKLFPEIDTLG